MRKVLFLDFDGVLHRYQSGTFTKVPLVVEFLRDHPDIDVVISSTWRYDNSLDELRQIFPVDIEHRIIAVTPDLSETTGRIARGFARITEIEAWLRGAGEDIVWRALDDEPGLFPHGAEKVVFTNSAEGVTPADIERLEQSFAGASV
ncbi:hypothetical protein F6X40_09665 [Paraburkholderia sp. UCT31]|uniref:HAD domain-containing protein n=1 Tax=Paraburkholderia sp. UCT31 TaxID=2615209 RepID=UPI0016561617|nr:HAD domain-containing protein [Paraburkholderia sp. UCT31]MBC8737075.1 hypothetical protein [Paraburkholderia sp. UCT31]